MATKEDGLGDQETKGQETPDKERDWGSYGDSQTNDPRLTHPEYIKSKREWKRYLSGEITAEELTGNLEGHDQQTEMLKDIFEGEEI